jgi:hypothetical protein
MSFCTYSVSFWFTGVTQQKCVLLCLFQVGSDTTWIKEIQCPVVPTCGYPHWQCVLQRCEVCPEYRVPMLKTQVDESAKTIKFHTYYKATKCLDHGDLPLNSNHCNGCNLLPETSKKGKVRTQKYLTLLMRPIGLFMTDFYIPLLKKYALHLAYIWILSKKGCGRMHFEWFKDVNALIVKTIRD